MAFTTRGFEQRSSFDVSGSTYISASYFVAKDATGYLVMGAATTGHVIMGVANKDVDNRTGAAAAVKAGFIWGCPVKVNADSTVSRTTVGSMVYVSGTAPSNTVKASGTAVNNEAGVLIDYTSSTDAWVVPLIGNRTDL